MTTRNPIKKTIVHLNVKRDECPIIARSGGDAAAIKKQFTKLNRVLLGIPLGPDPAIELKKIRKRRGLV